MRQIGIRYTSHALNRLAERISLSTAQLSYLLERDLCVAVGVDPGSLRVHRLFYSPPDRVCFSGGFPLRVCSESVAARQLLQPASLFQHWPAEPYGWSMDQLIWDREFLVESQRILYQKTAEKGLEVALPLHWVVRFGKGRPRHFPLFDVKLYQGLGR